MLPRDVRNQLLTQARRQSYTAAETRAIMMAQEAANNMYINARNGDANINPANPNIAIPSVDMEGGQTVSMHSFAQMVGADPSVYWTLILPHMRSALTSYEVKFFLPKINK